MKEIKHIEGKEYWRSLNQLADTPEFRQILEREFPQGASELKNSLNRRNFLGLMGASIALAGLSACRRPVEKIIPYVKAPEQVIPGIPRYYASTMPLGTAAYGVVVENHEGRPTKIEGNSLHPSSLGKSNSLMQASILNLYDPDRSQRILYKGEEKKWTDLTASLNTLYQSWQENKGQGLAILCESFSSPTLNRLKRVFQDKYPQAQWVTYSPINQENVHEGLRIATGQSYQPLYHYDKARVILSLDADFLLTENENVKATNQFAGGRKVNSTADQMNRLYVVEPSYTITGANADHRLKLPAAKIAAFSVMLAKELSRQGVDIPLLDEIRVEGKLEIDNNWLTVLAADLIAARGNCLLVAGSRQPAQVHALLFLMNMSLENVGRSVTYRQLTDTSESRLSDLIQLAGKMQNGEIETLIILGGNPVYDAPADLNFLEALNQVQTSIHLSEALNETSASCLWHIPQAHYLETWGDARAVDGSLSLIQPSIAPLFDSHSLLELLQLINNGTERSAYEITRQTWEKFLNRSDFENEWRRVLHDGILKNSQLPPENPPVNRTGLREYFKNNPFWIHHADKNNLEIVFLVSPAVYDGRFANNGWLQELPDTVTKLAWDNAALISPKTAKSLGVKNEDLIVLNLQGRELSMPVWILPGQADFSVAVSLGYGRKTCGRVGTGVGFNSYLLRTSRSLSFDLGLTIRRTLDIYPLANTQDHGSMEGRPLVRESTIDQYRNSPDFAQKMVKHLPLVSLWDEHSYEEGYQWGMSIDLNACTGCNACAIACQSENNIPIIGKEQVRNGREMHWMRLDRYFSGDAHNPQVVHQPVACQHCEMAPCEQVCPVAATVHDSEGLNVMTYNRCVGTRYCSNNCPYKVRRFNFFNYTNQLPEIVKMAQNPDVTVRSRGVMEKCTYCLQRINYAKIEAKNQDRQIKDGEFKTACQQACPADAIVFGNINDVQSAVSEARSNERRYEMLAELNVKPRTSYLAKLRNPNPELEG